ncbi:MAG: hypothetical protein JW904_04815 [Spirochaetales bacterium]|nr:hypothetical protein [Spirochaetales bacterium]
MSLYVPLLIIKIAAVIASSIMLIFYFRLKKKKELKKAKILLIVLIICGVLFWMNIGIFRPSGVFVYNWEQFHYFLGTKYFPELGYDGIYVAALQANEEIDPAFFPPFIIRDLRTDKEVYFSAIHSHKAEVRSRFSDERWNEFVEDVKGFPLNKSIFLDHGYNPTPPFTFIARLFTAWLPVNDITKTLLGLVDILLAIACCVLIAQYFNLERAALFSVVFGIGFVYYFGYLGGSILRFDWFLAMTLTLCYFQKKQFEFAGMSFAYMVIARVFPIFLLAGLAVYWIRKKRFRPAFSFSRGFLIMTLILLVLGCFAGRGIQAYPENYQNLANFSISTSGLSLQYLFMTSWENLSGQHVNEYSNHINAEVVQEYQDTRQDNIILVIIGTAAALLFVFFSIAHARTPGEALAMSMAIIFCIITLNFYYWVILVFAVFFRSKFTIKSMIVISFITYIWLALYLSLVLLRHIPHLYSALTFLPLIVMLTVFFFLWFRPLFWQNARPLLLKAASRLLKRKGK